MRLSRKVKLLLAAAACAATLAFAPGVAQAQTLSDFGHGEDTLLTKTWSTSERTPLNNDETFQFKLAYSTATSVASNVKPQDFSDFSKTVSLTSKWLDNAKGGLSSQASLKVKDLFVDADGHEVDFTTPGVYTFSLTEVAGKNVLMTYDATKYNVKVGVSYPDDYPAHTDAVIKTFVIEKVGAGSGSDAANQKVDVATFNNVSKDRGTLVISKTVTGSAANVNDSFTFRVSFRSAGVATWDDSSDYWDKTIPYVLYTKDHPEGVQKTVTFNDYESVNSSISSDGQMDIATITLKNGERAEFPDRPDGTSYRVKEMNSGYTAAATVNGAAYKLEADSKGQIVWGTITHNTETVAYTNTRGYVAPTGISSDVLPLAGVGVLAVAGATVLGIVRHRRRKSREEF